MEAKLKQNSVQSSPASRSKPLQAFLTCVLVTVLFFANFIFSLGFENLNYLLIRINKFLPHPRVLVFSDVVKLSVNASSMSFTKCSEGKYSPHAVPYSSAPAFCQ